MSNFDKTQFSPIFDPFWSKKAHFQGILGCLMSQNVSPQARDGLNVLVRASQMVQDHLWKNPFLTHFEPIFGPKWPLFKAFWDFPCGKRVPTGSKLAKNTCLSIPSGAGSLLEKCVFDPFLTHFPPQNNPFLRQFGIFHGPKRVTMGSKPAKSTCLSMPSGLGTPLEQMIFFALGPTVGPHRARAALPSGSTK